MNWLKLDKVEHCINLDKLIHLDWSEDIYNGYFISLIYENHSHGAINIYFDVENDCKECYNLICEMLMNLRG